MASGLEVTVDTKGLEQAIRDDPAKVERWLNGFAEDMVSRIVLSFGTSPAGRSYRRKGGRVHVASQAGNPPNPDIGTLRASIYQEPTGTLEHTIYAGTEYAVYLEDGAEDVGLAARPFMGPAFDDAQSRIENDAVQNLGLDG